MLNRKTTNFLKNKNILVTGATGMVGRQVVNFLNDIECNIIINSLDDISKNIFKKSKAKIVFKKGDLRDFKFCLELTKNIDLVFHIAGIKSSPVITKERPATFFVPLLMMNTNILEASRINNIKRLVYTSSIGAYDKKNILTEGKDTKEPLDLAPGWAKRMAEYQIHNYKIEYPNNNFFSCRLSNVFGPGDNFDIKTSMVIPSLIFKAINSKGKRIKLLGTGNEIRDFIYSKDVAFALIKVLIKGYKGLPYLNIGSGKGITIKKLAESIANHIPFKFYFESNDKIVGYNKRVLSSKNLFKQVGFIHNYELNIALGETIDWFKNNSKEYNKRYNYFDKS